MVDIIEKIFGKNPKSELARLISLWVEAEARLDAALKALNDYAEGRVNSNLNLDFDYHKLKKSSDIADKEWKQRYLDVLNYDPENIQEIGQKILINLNSISEGLSDPRLFQSIEKCAHKLLETDPATAIDLSDHKFDNQAINNSRFFIIDDSEFDRMLIKQAFLSQNDNLDLVELENGKSVIEAIKLKKPVATLLDLNMPFVSGLEILKMIRRDTELKDHPVWIISASSKEGDKTQSLSSGADGYYVKPDSLAAYNEMAADILECVSA